MNTIIIVGVVAIIAVGLWIETTQKVESTTPPVSGGGGGSSDEEPW